MNIGIVSTWFERGAAIVSKQFEFALQENHDIFIYARGEEYAINDPKWDRENVYWSRKIESPLSYFINEDEFSSWIVDKEIDLVIFNEQRYWPPILWCAKMNVKTVAYVDYYTEDTAKLYSAYDAVICNTLKHCKAMDFHHNLLYLPWGTDISVYKPKILNNLANDSFVTFFHSAGMNPHRKGTDILIEAFYLVKDKVQSKLVIHSQVPLVDFFPDLFNKIDCLISSGQLEVIVKTVSAPGLYHLGDIYVYPSRLDGLGLTVVEAISSGLGVIVTDDGPMNEFCNKKVGDAIAVERFVSRKDGYYWPQAFPCINDLSEKLEYYSVNINRTLDIKMQARALAERKYNWETNSKNLVNLLDSVVLGDVSYKEKLINRAVSIDDAKYPYISKLSPVYNFLYKLYKLNKGRK